MYGMNKINIAIIGNNFGKKVHLPAFQTIPNVNAIVYSKNNWLDAMNGSIDAVSIAVSPTSSFEVITTAIKHNKQIFCEKPLATNLTDAIQIQKLLPSSIIHAIDFELCESRIIKKMKFFLDSEKLGQILSFRLVWEPLQTYDTHSWKLDSSKGGGVLNNFGSHILYLLEWLFSKDIKKIFGNVFPNEKNNTEINIDVEFDRFSGKISVALCKKQMAYFILEVICKYGSFILENKTNILQNFSLQISKKNALVGTIIDYENDTSNKDGRINLVNSLATKFINGIRTNAQIHPNINDGVRVQFLINELLGNK